MKSKLSGEVPNGYAQQIRGGDSGNTHELAIGRLETTGSKLAHSLRWEHVGGRSIMLPKQPGVGYKIAKPAK